MTINYNYKGFMEKALGLGTIDDFLKIQHIFVCLWSTEENIQIVRWKKPQEIFLGIPKQYMQNVS